MADTAPTTLTERSTESRVIRIFLSSTFRDFMEERDLLVKQVFPELRRKARERGVEVVDVDLRWGITEEESRQGKVIPICLGEIDRCRPYFVGMLGERYGWIPPADQYSPEVIERQPWLKDHLGGVSVTELEILHGVLNDPAMAGRAFFHFRDPAWSTSQSEAGFVCETAEEEAKLTDLKQRIRSSGFPVAENLPDPKALADQIGHDLWELIEQQYPDLDEADALEREERQHASYRRSRLGVYLGGKRSINQLDRWIDAGQQKILITGESGAGKSALIANWIQAHQQNHPEDVVFAHHLGCSHDASAVRQLLARLIDTAKQQLPEVYGYSLSVPQDWWELVAKAVEALQSLARWAQQNNHRWIWVLDGLDRLDPDDQNALPWLPLTIPEGVVIMASALECPAREILLERKFKTRTIAPLKAKEQDALIKQYLGRYTKQLVTELRQRIVIHPLAGSPLFLRVLLEELRQCGRYETLADQLAGYLSAETIDDLYERVLERLEADGNGENVRKVTTALWASRAGLSEEELLSITGLKQLQWAPIDLALEEALGRNGNRLVFDHDYLRKAAEDRYLVSEKQGLQIHSELADWFYNKEKWDERKAEELPWQLVKSRRLSDLSTLLCDPWIIAHLAHYSTAREIAGYWHGAKGDPKLDLGLDLDEIIEERVSSRIELLSDDPEELIGFAVRIAEVLDACGLRRRLSLKLSELAVELQPQSERKDRRKSLELMNRLAFLHLEMGNHGDSLKNFKSCIKLSTELYGRGDQETLSILNDYGLALTEIDSLTVAKAVLSEVVGALEKQKQERPLLFNACNNLAIVHARKGDAENAEILYNRALSGMRRVVGGSGAGINTLNNLASLYSENGRPDLAEKFFEEAVALTRENYGESHPYHLLALNNFGEHYVRNGGLARGISLLEQSLGGRERILGLSHPHTIGTLVNLCSAYEKDGNDQMAVGFSEKLLKQAEHRYGLESLETMQYTFAVAELYSRTGNYDRSIPLRRRELIWCRNRDNNNHRNLLSTLTSIHCLANDLYWSNNLRESEQLYREALQGRIDALGDDNDATMDSRYGLTGCLSAQGCYTEAIELRKVELAWCRQQNGDTDLSTLASLHELAVDLRQVRELDEAEALFRELLRARQQVLAPEDFMIGQTLGDLAKTLEQSGKWEQALEYWQQALQHHQRHEGHEAWWTNRIRLDLALGYLRLGEPYKALSLLGQLQISMKAIGEPDHLDAELMEEAEALRKDLEFLVI